MLSYLQKFNKLPKQLRDKVSAPEVMAAIEELEKKYKVDLAAIVMRIMVKDLMVSDLVKYFVSEFKMEDVQADKLAAELKEKIFVGVTDYLGIKDAHGSASAAPPLFANPALREGRGKSVPQKKEKLIPHARKASHAPMGPSSEKRANFFFSTEDEQEIREFSKKINGYVEQESFSNQIGERLDKIIKQTQINFGSAQLVHRFKQILKTYFRGIRDRIEAKQTLVKPFEAGGLNFDQESAEKVLLIADSNFKDLGKADEIQSPASRIFGVRDIDYDLAKELKKKKNGGKSNRLDTQHKLAPPPPMLRRTSPPPLSSSQNSVFQDKAPSSAVKLRRGAIEEDHKAPAIKLQQTSRSPFVKKDVKIKQIQSVSPIRKMPSALDKLPARGQKDFSNRVNHDYGLASRSSQARQASASPASRPAVPPPFAKSGVREWRGGGIGDKVKMEDVKYAPKIVSPIDELKYMNLINFRRLEQNLNKIVAKIKQKIDLLEEENYAQRLAGIKAWRVSPVNRLYLEMGQISINSNKPIDVVIEERKTKGHEYLNSQEFKAVMDLNQSLRF